jgi:hypothetical protein
MTISHIRYQITQNLSMMHSHRFFEERLKQLATVQGIQLDKNGITSITLSVEQYVYQTVDLIETCANAASQVGLGEFVAPILNGAAQYFMTPQDYLPDHTGLYGLLDDAYLARCLISQVSDLYRQQMGVPLLPFDIHPDQLRQVVRALIGEPVATQLDQVVANTIHQALIQHLNGLYAQQARTLPVQSGSRTGGPGSWGNNFESEIARQAAELGISFD